MPRKKVNIKVNGPFHVSSRCINKEWFSLPMERVWKIFEHHLYFLTTAFKFEIHAFVLMNNHYHMIVSTPEHNLSDGMAYFLREVSRELNHNGNRLNRTFAGRYFRCNLKSPHYFANCYKYVYQNPLRAGIVESVSDYPFSTLYYLLGRGKLNFPMAEDDLLFSGPVEENIKWLNSLPEEQDLVSVRNALKKGEFRLAKDNNLKKPNRLEYLLL